MLDGELGKNKKDTKREEETFFSCTNRHQCILHLIEKVKGVDG